MEQKDYEKALQKMWAERAFEGRPEMVVGFVMCAASGFVVGVCVGLMIG